MPREFERRLAHLCWALFLVPIPTFAQALPDPPGPYCPISVTQTAQLRSFDPGEKVVGVYYFYWYRWKDACAGSLCDPIYSRAHIEFATGWNDSGKPSDALTNHPPHLEHWDFADPAWHSRQLDQIASASMDLILPVFWGVPGRYGEGGHNVAAWSKLGLEALAKALAEREKEGKPLVRVGMFYDTSTLTFESPFNYPQGHKTDLRTEQGKKHFYCTIRDFFSLIPPRFWGLVEGHPLVWLYASEFSSGYDDTLLPFARAQFVQDFAGLEPLFVAHLDWHGIGAEWDYRWGAAIQPNYLSVSTVGPGFDNSGAHGLPRGSKVLREREEGAFYRNAWERALRHQAPFVIVETWNELHEGTEICPTREYGEEYLRITGHYARAFKNPEDTPPMPGPHAGEKTVSWQSGKAEGLEPIRHEDGEFRIQPSPEGAVIETASPYLYFAVEDSFCFANHEPLMLEIEVFDFPKTGADRFGSAPAVFIEYDSWDRDANFHGIYRATEPSPLAGKLGWTKHRFPLEAACLANNQNGGADFRVVAPRGLRLRSVSLTKGTE